MPSDFVQGGRLKFLFRDTYIGGPVHWVHENYRCPNCHFWPEDPCCQNVPDGQFCKSDSLDFKDDPNVIFHFFCILYHYHHYYIFTLGKWWM